MEEATANLLPAHAKAGATDPRDVAARLQSELKPLADDFLERCRRTLRPVADKFDVVVPDVEKFFESLADKATVALADSPNATYEMTPFQKTLADKERALLQRVYDRFRDSGQWPPVHTLQIELRQEMKVRRAAAAIGTGLIVCEDGGDGKCRLTLLGIAHCTDSEDDLANFTALIRFLASSYVSNPGVIVRSEEIKAALAMEEAAMTRLRMVIKGTVWGIWGTSTWPNDSQAFTLTPSEEAAFFEKVATVDEYLELKDQLNEEARETATLHIGRSRRTESWPEAMRTTAPKPSEKADLLPIYRRQVLDEDLPNLVEMAERLRRPLSFLMMDLDRFKAINDTYGHQAADGVLVACTAILLRRMEGKGRTYRYGGEELAVLLPNFDAEEAAAVAEGFRKDVAKAPIGENKIPVTVSIGVAAVPDHADSAEELVNQADAVLYECKENGRNLVRIAGQPIPDTDSS